MLRDLVLSNRSYRGYDETRKITKEELLSFVELARLSPSSVNVQPFKYYLAYENDVVAKLQATTKWAKALPTLELPHLGAYPTAFIVICQDLNISNSIPRFQKDVGIVAQTMLLGATEIGLGGCMIGNYSAKEVVNALSLTENLQPVLIVAFGKPTEKIILTEITSEENTTYYRDAQDTHYVPKRKLSDLII